MNWILPLFAALALASGAAPAEGQERVVESVVPSLAYETVCSSTVELQSLSDRPVVVDVEAHRAGGALVPMVGHPEITVRLSPRERSIYKLQIEEETESAWVKVRERVPSPGLFCERGFDSLRNNYRHARKYTSQGESHHPCECSRDGDSASSFLIAAVGMAISPAAWLCAIV